MNNPEGLNTNRPETEIMPALKNALRTYGDVDTLQKGFFADAIRSKRITSISQVEAIKDALGMQRDEEIEAIKSTTSTPETDPRISIIDSEIHDIESLLSIGNAINERVRGELDTLKEKVLAMDKEDAGLIERSSEEDILNIVKTKAKSLRLFQMSEDEEWALNLVHKREDSRERQQSYIESEVQSIAKEIKEGR